MLKYECLKFIIKQSYVYIFYHKIMFYEDKHEFSICFGILAPLPIPNLKSLKHNNQSSITALCA